MFSIIPKHNDTFVPYWKRHKNSTVAVPQFFRYNALYSSNAAHTLTIQFSKISSPTHAAFTPPLQYNHCYRCPCGYFESHCTEFSLSYYCTPLAMVVSFDGWNVFCSQTKSHYKLLRWTTIPVSLASHINLSPEQHPSTWLVPSVTVTPTTSTTSYQTTSTNVTGQEALFIGYCVAKYNNASGWCNLFCPKNFKTLICSVPCMRL